ncbi:putative phosphinothricin acetyltransferase YwnH [compost metagenome]
MQIRMAEPRDADAIAGIYNQGIEERSATFETSCRTGEAMLSRINMAEQYPLLVMVDDAGLVVAWAGLSSYRPRACYDGIADFSIYLDRGVRGLGHGKGLLQALLAEAERRGFWKVLSRIFTCNEASLALCRSCGFREVGVYQRHACLDGRWLDCAIVERLFPTNQPN